MYDDLYADGYELARNIHNHLGKLDFFMTTLHDADTSFLRGIRDYNRFHGGK